MSTRIIAFPQLALSSALVFVLLATVGCGDGKLAVHPIQGIVKVDGKPAGGAMIFLCPVGGSAQLQHERPYATAGQDGKFSLTTFVKDDGAPVGEYKVLVQWIGPPKPGADRDRGEGSPDRLRGKYMNLENTPLTASITKSTTELPPLELKSQ